MNNEELREQIRLVIAGHVDHGKSTLIGRLVHDTGHLPDGKYEQIRAGCERRGVAFEWSFLMDALQAERSQGITIDMTQLWLRLEARDYVLIDAPGHHEFLKNMMTGAAEADAAILMVDVAEGMREQSRKHAYLLHLLGIRQVIVVINKMDKVGYDRAHYEEVAESCRAYLDTIELTAQAMIPVSAYNGVMVQEAGEAMPWYDGMTLVEALAGLTPVAHNADAPLRLPVQDVYKFDDRRIIAGTLESGQLRAGDEILISPGNYTARVASLEGWPAAGDAAASAGQAIGITLDEQRFVERGHVISHVVQPPILTNQFYARLFWMGHTPLTVGASYTLRINTASYQAEVRAIHHVIDTNTLEEVPSDVVARHQVADILWQVRGLAVLDAHDDLPASGRCVVIDEHRICGGGILSMGELADQRVAPQAVKSEHLFTEEMMITTDQRESVNGHKGGILWFTGLSGSGKSTLAKELQQQLFARGYQVYVLDGDNVRQGLNADLGFAPEDRAENIRRVGEVAALFADAGMIVISAFISPYGEDRRRARAAAPEQFHTVHIQADLATCEARDTKGLYKKARDGEISEFTGISAPYEIPDNPELVIDTAGATIDACVAQLLAYVEKHFGVV